MRRLVTSTACLLAVGCGQPPASASDVAATSTTGTTEAVQPTPSTSSGTTAPSTTSPVDAGTGTTTGEVIPDLPARPQCDPLQQDCPRGTKCTFVTEPVEHYGCVDVAADPAQDGAPCEIGERVGHDDCDVGLVCWDAGLGPTCSPWCMGSEACPDGSSCSGGNWVSLCVATCDPLVQDCVEGLACYPINDSFACAPDDSGPTGTHGDPCRYINACDPGYFCVAADAFTDCPSGVGCCSTLCEHTDPLADDACAALDPNQSCQAWFVEGMAPAGYENVGVCALPL